MNFEDLHNEINSYPAELKYTDASWEGALKVIKAHERKQAAKKWGLISVCLLLISFGGYSALQSKTNQLTDYEPRLESISKTVTTLFQYDETSSETNSGTNSGIKISEETAQLSPSSNENTPQSQVSQVAQDDANQDNSGGVFVEAPSRGEEKAFNNNFNTDSSTESDVEENSLGGIFKGESHPEDMSFNELEINPDDPSNDETIGNSEPQNTPPNYPSVVDLTQDLGIDNDINQRLLTNSKELVFTPYLGFIQSKLPNLRINSPSRLVRGEELKLKSKRRFSAPRAFIGIKLGAIPMAEFGRTNKFFRTEFSAGAFIQKPLTEKLGYNLGLDYLEMSGMGSPISSTHTTYGFGFENRITTIYTDKVQFLSVPANLTFDINNRIQLETGLGLDYLLNSKNTLEQSVETNTKFETISAEQTSGYFASFNRALLNTNLGINYWVTPRYKLGVNYQFGLSDMTKNAAFNSDIKDRNTRLNFTLRRVIR